MESRHRKSWLFKGCLSGSRNEMEKLNFRADRSPKHGNFGMDGLLVKSIDGLNVGNGDAGIEVSRLQQEGNHPNGGC